ncbi:MAG: hypothetical protein H6999_06845 [Hahellaceae bacterium]|nr:hypothetical protein [Hahellaceae bacterium]
MISWFRVSGVMSASLLLSAVAFADVPLSETQDWKLLHYSGSKFLISLDATVGFSMLSAEDAKKQLYVTDQGNGYLPKGEKAILLTTESSVLGNHSSFKTWLDTDMRALERSAIYSGRKDWARVYRYFPDKVYGLKAKPVGKAEKSLPWSQWTNRSEGYFPVEKNSQALVLTEPMGLFYLLRISEFKEPGDLRTFYVYDRDGTLVVNLRAEAKETIKVDYVSKGAGKEKRVKGKMEILRLTVDAKPLSADKKEAEFDFMGYKDSINVFYDPLTRIVFRVNGSVDYVGNVEINLEEVTY